MTTSASSETTEAALAGGTLARRWIAVVTPGEFAGFAVPALAGAATAGAAAIVQVPALVAAGAVEGAVLGLAQATVLARALPGLPRGRWVAATALAAALAYVAGLLPSTASMTDWPALPAIAVGVVLAVVLLGSLGTAQWWVLRGLVPWARRWIGVTAGAWLLGLAVFLGFTTPLWQEGQPGVVIAVIGVAGGALMAVTTSAVTGWALAGLIPAGS